MLNAQCGDRSKVRSSPKCGYEYIIGIQVNVKVEQKVFDEYEFLYCKYSEVLVSDRNPKIYRYRKELMGWIFVLSVVHLQICLYIGLLRVVIVS